MFRNLLGFCAALALACSPGARAQVPGDSSALIGAQKEAMKSLEMLDGVWRGPAWILRPDGTRHEMTQTERVGPLLDGALRIIEGRAYDPDGSVSFTAFAVVSYDPVKKRYSMRSHAMGRIGDFDLTPAADGFSWVVPAGPKMTIRYTARIKDGTWREVGERIVEGQTPVRFFEMDLKRVGDTSWPAGGAVAKN